MNPASVCFWNAARDVQFRNFSAMREINRSRQLLSDMECFRMDLSASTLTEILAGGGQEDQNFKLKIVLSNCLASTRKKADIFYVSFNLSII